MGQSWTQPDDITCQQAQGYDHYGNDKRDKQFNGWVVIPHDKAAKAF